MVILGWAVTAGATLPTSDHAAVKGAAKVSATSWFLLAAAAPASHQLPAQWRLLLMGERGMCGWEGRERKGGGGE